MTKQQFFDYLSSKLTDSQSVLTDTDLQVSNLMSICQKSRNTIKRYLKEYKDLTGIDIKLTDARCKRKEVSTSGHLSKEVFLNCVTALAISNMIPSPFGDMATDIILEEEPKALYKTVAECVAGLTIIDPPITAKELIEAQSILDSVFERSFEDVSIPEEHHSLLRDLFIEVLNGHQPLEEQIQLVYRIYLSSRRDSGFPKLSVVQSIAGASKTTCIKVLCKFMDAIENDVPIIVSATHAAITDFHNGKTVQRFINDKLHINIVECAEGNDPSSIVRICKSRVGLGVIKKVPFLIVEEYSQVSDFYVAILNELAERVLFIGDFGQARRISCIPGKVIGSLDTSFRFRGNEEVAKEATNLRYLNNVHNMREYIKSLKQYEFSGDLIPKHKRSKNGQFVSVSVKTSYTKAFQDPVLKEALREFKDFDTQIVAYSLEAVDAINYSLVGSVDSKGKPSVIAGCKVYVHTFDPRYPDARQGTLWRVLMIVEDVCTLENPLTGAICKAKISNLEVAYAISTIKAQGKEWSKVAAILGTSHRGAFLEDCYVQCTRAIEDTVVFYRRDLDKSLLSTTETFSASHDMSNTSSKHSLTLRCLTGVSRYCLESLGRDEREIRNAFSYALQQVLKGDISSASNQAAYKNLIEDTVEHWEASIKESELELTEPEYGCVYTTPNTGKRFLPASSVKQALGVVKAKPASMSPFLYQELKGSNIVVIDTDNKEATELLYEMFKDKTEIWINEDHSKAHFVFGADLLYPSRTSNHEKCALPIDLLGNSKSQKRFFKPNKKKILPGANPLLMTKELYRNIYLLRKYGVNNDITTNIRSHLN